MNDFSDLEKELKDLRPAPASDRLISAVERAVQEIHESHPSAAILARKNAFSFPKLRFAFGLGLAAAAAALVVLLQVRMPIGAKPKNMASSSPLPNAAAIPPVPSSSFIPSDATQVVYNVRDEGLVFPSGSAAPVRRVRSQTRESLQWRNPKTGASLVVSYPAEQVRWIPVSGQ